MPSSNERELARKVIWAMGGNRSGEIAHAYANEEAYRNNICLCGKGVHPVMRFDDWDLSNELISEHTCPQCRERMRFLAYLSHMEPKEEKK